MKKPEQYYRETAEELAVDLKDVKQINKFFWKVGVKEELRKVNHTAIYVKNIATILVSKRKLYNEIKHLIVRIRYTERFKKHGQTKKDYMIQGYKARLTTLLRKRNELIKEGLYDR